MKGFISAFVSVVVLCSYVCMSAPADCTNNVCELIDCGPGTCIKNSDCTFTCDCGGGVLASSCTGTHPSVPVMKETILVKVSPLGTLEQFLDPFGPHTDLFGNQGTEPDTTLPPNTTPMTTTTTTTTTTPTPVPTTTTSTTTSTASSGGSGSNSQQGSQSQLSGSGSDYKTTPSPISDPVEMVKRLQRLLAVGPSVAASSGTASSATTQAPITAKAPATTQVPATTKAPTKTIASATTAFPSLTQKTAVGAGVGASSGSSSIPGQSGSAALK